MLVVIVIILVLASLGFQIGKSTRRSALKVTDMTNLRSLAVAAMASGTDNGGQLPRIHTPGNQAPYWLTSRETLESFGIFKESCYIPNKNIDGGPPKYDWWFGFGASTPIHYCYFANDAKPGETPWFLAGSVTPPAEEEYRGATPYRTIIRDTTKAFARSASDDAWYPVLWAGLCRDYGGKKTVAAIMEAGKPLGVNVLLIDGSGKWVDKADMKARYSASGGLKIYW